VPIAVKDIIDHAGRVTTCGSAFYRGLATVTAPSLQALLDAGAVAIGRAGLHEWAFGFSSENPHWGVIRNPWDPTTSPGGSSGGSAVAVAVGLTPIAMGTDTGGSVRVPAALCGTYGLKVTHGRIPLEGVFPLVPSIDTVGPLADSVEHLSLAYRVMSGDAAPEPGPASLRIGLPQPWFDDAPMAGEVETAFRSVVERLVHLGHRVESVEVPGFGPSGELIWAIADEVREIHREFRQRGELYGDDVTRRLDEADATTDSQIRAGRDWQERMRQSLATAFAGHDLLITPTVPVRSKTIGEEMIGDRHYRSVLSYFSAVVNHTLHPAIAMPLTGTGAPPLSLQAIGPMGSEPLLLGFARSLQDAGISSFTVARSNPQGLGRDTIR
jgi:aspartyl-tRNA(Asn)/glutamyl-tRNA(Gln) amidotransferase subunit A